MKHRARALKHRARNQRGFTMLEATVALLVMMVVALGVSSLFVYAVKYNTGANNRAQALALAQQQLEGLRQLPFSDASLSAGTTTTIAVGNGTNETPRKYQVVKTVVNENSSTMKLITIQVTPLGADGAWAGTPVSLVTRRSATTMGTYTE